MEKLEQQCVCSRKVDDLRFSYARLDAFSAYVDWGEGVGDSDVDMSLVLVMRMDDVIRC